MKQKPTESELEIMQILWEKGPLTVRQVNEILNEKRRVGYTTTLKIMQIMTEKALLHRDTTERSHIYSAVPGRTDISTNMTDHLIDTVFRGSRAGLVLNALGHRKVSSEELKEIKALIQSLEDKAHGDL